MECKWINNISPFFLFVCLIQALAVCLFSNIIAVLSNVAFTVAVYTLKVALSFACFSKTTWMLIGFEFSALTQWGRGKWSRLCQLYLQQNASELSDSLVFKCITESTRPWGYNHWSYGRLPSLFFFFLDLCLQIGLFIIIYIFGICLICGYALLSLYMIFLL